MNQDSDSVVDTGSQEDSDSSMDLSFRLRSQRGERQRDTRRQSRRKASTHQERLISIAHQKVGERLKKKNTFAVTCGNKEGILYKDKFNKGKACILSGGQWFTPTKFEHYGGKKTNKKWKISIFHNKIPLQTLIQNRFLSSPMFNRKRSQDEEPENRKKTIWSRTRTKHGKNSHVATSDSSSESNCSDGDTRDRNVDQDDGNGDDDDGHNGDSRAAENAFVGESFTVKCSKGTGVLHVNRFATETCGKCIRTQDAWLTPKDFLNRNIPNGNWRRDITSKGVPIGTLLMRRVLQLHAVNCDCPICEGDEVHLLDQNNDDVCFECRHDGDLVCCEKCPRVFHHHCHNPVLSDDIIGEHWTCSFCMDPS